MSSNNYVYLNTTLTENPELEIFDVGFIKKYYDNGFCQVFFLKMKAEYVISKNLITEFDISKTGDRYDNKVCDRCYKYLNTKENFSDNRLKKDNIITKRPSCKKCRKIKDGVNIPTTERRKWENKRPLNGSLFSCPICNKTTIVGISKIVLDHNHSTGEVRGWLCESCNTGIGRFDDNTDIIKNAIKWLERNN